jgi:hypothetical protein
VESEDDKNFFRVYSRPFETQCTTAGEVPAVSTRLGVAEETDSSVDCCVSATKHSEGHKQIPELDQDCMAQVHMLEIHLVHFQQIKPSPKPGRAAFQTGLL